MAPYIARMVLSVSRHGIEHDIELARKMISENGLGLVAIKEGKVIMEAEDRGIRPFVQAVIELGEKLRGAVIGDRVTGRLPPCYASTRGGLLRFTLLWPLIRQQRNSN